MEGISFFLVFGSVGRRQFFQNNPPPIHDSFQEGIA